MPARLPPAALSDGDRLALAAAMVRHQTPATEARRLAELTAQLDLPDGGDRPWTQGYDLARAWGGLCQLDEEAALDSAEHLASPGVGVREIELSDRNTTGVALVLAERAPFILLNRACAKRTGFEGHPYPSGRRSTLAHEPCHLLVDRLAGAELALASGPWAPKAVEQRANAFAAALLMPDALVVQASKAHQARPSAGTAEDLIAAARTLDVSPDALSHHLYNRGFIELAEREVLRAQWVRAKARTGGQDGGRPRGGDQGRAATMNVRWGPRSPPARLKSRGGGA